MKVPDIFATPPKSQKSTTSHNDLSSNTVERSDAAGARPGTSTSAVTDIPFAKYRGSARIDSAFSASVPHATRSANTSTRSPSTLSWNASSNALTADPTSPVTVLNTWVCGIGQQRNPATDGIKNPASVK